MSQRQQRRQQVIVSIAIISVLIIALLLPITTNIATGYLSALPSWVEGWVKGHIIWFWVAIVVFGLLAVTLAGITAHLQLNGDGKFLPSEDELESSRIKVDSAESEVYNDPMLKNNKDRFSILADWKRLIKSLTSAYYDYKERRDRESQNYITQTADLLEKLVKITRRSFVYLDRKFDFAEIARPAYDVMFELERWKDAADLAYESGRVSYDLRKKYKGGLTDWIAVLRTCSEKATSNSYWVKVYNEVQPETSGALDEPSDSTVHSLFYEALAYAAKLYHLEGLSKGKGDNPKVYLDKALRRAEKLSDKFGRPSDKVLCAWIKIHIAELEPQSQQVADYTDALMPLEAIDLAPLDPLQRSDIINLKLTCYYHLGSLTSSNESESWYQKQLEMAEEYGSLDFQILAHIKLAHIDLKRKSSQTSSPDQSASIQNAYMHIEQAWKTNYEYINQSRVMDEDFIGKGNSVVVPNELAQLMEVIVNEFMQRSAMNSSGSSSYTANI